MNVPASTPPDQDPDALPAPDAADVNAAQENALDAESPPADSAATGDASTLEAAATPATNDEPGAAEPTPFVAESAADPAVVDTPPEHTSRASLQGAVRPWDGPAGAAQRDYTVAATITAFAIGIAVVIGAYVGINDAALHAGTSAQTYAAAKMGVSRGTGRLDGGVLVARQTGSDVLLVSVPTDFRAREFRSVLWDVTGLPSGADVRLLFSSDYTPRRVHNRPLTVEDGRIGPITLTDDREWLGRITGLAIAVRAPGATIHVRGVTLKSLSLRQLAADRVAEWSMFESWTGTSINSVTGGAPAQSLPLPVPLMIAALLALGALLAARKFLPARLPRGVAPIAALLFVIAWVVLDARWTLNLARQVAATFERYGGKDTAERALAAEDGDLVAFLDKARALLPPEPQRIVVLAQAHYFRGRAGWHLYPHRVLWEPARDAAPPPGTLRPGDYVVVWQRPGAQFDKANGRVRFDNGVELAAAPLLVERGSAVFAIN